MSVVYSVLKCTEETIYQGNKFLNWNWPPTAVLPTRADAAGLAGMLFNDPGVLAIRIDEVETDDA